MGVLAVQALLISIDPVSVSRGIHQRYRFMEMTHIVFQLKRPSYLMLRRYGSRVKSTLPSNSSSSGKNSWKLGASSAIVEKSRPVGVTCFFTSWPCGKYISG